MKKHILIWCILGCLLAACSQQQTTTTLAVPSSKYSEIATDPSYMINDYGDTILTGTPITVKGKKIPAEWMASPIKRPIGSPKIITAYQNTFEALPSKRVKIPDKLPFIILGENGEPAPDTLKGHIKGTVMPPVQPQRVKAGLMQMTEQARYDIRYLDVKGGVRSNILQNIMMDSKGRLWYATFDAGMAQFDGQYFKYFSTKTGLSSTRVSSIEEDKSGNFWIGTYTSGIYYYDGHQFTRFGAKENFPLGYLQTFKEDEAGNLWLLTQRSIIQFIPDKDNNTGKELKGRALIYKEGYIGRKNLVTSRFGHVWIATKEKGLTKYILSKDGPVEKRINFTKKEGLFTENINAIMEDRKGDLWIGTAEDGLIKYESNENGTGGYFTYFPIAESLKEDGINHLLEAGDGAIWFSTQKNGVFRFEPPANDKNNGQYARFSTENGLRSNSIGGLAEDDQGNIWIATTNGGICRLDLNSFTNFGLEAGLAETPVKKVMEDSKGNIWFGTGLYSAAGKGLFQYDGAHFINYTTENGLNTNTIMAIEEDAYDNLWLSNFGSLHFLDDAKENIYQIAPNIIVGSYVMDLFKGRDNNLFVGGGGDICLKVFPSKTEGDNYPFYSFTQKEGMSDRQMLQLFQDKCGNLWFGGGTGLGRFEMKNNLEEAEFYFFNDSNYINLFIETITEDHKGRIWFGTQDQGIIVYEPKGCDSIGTFTYFTKENGLLDNGVTSIIEDKEKRIWIGTFQGLCLLKPQSQTPLPPNASIEEEYQIFTYNNQDGLPEVSFMPVCLDSKNQLWWGRNKGVSRLNLNTFRLPTEPPHNVQLSHIDIQQKQIDYRQLTDTIYSNQLAFGAELSESIDSTIAFQNYPATLDLSYDLNHLTFHFSAIDWAAPHKIKYSYYLDGLEKEWSEPNAESKADYRNLPFGNFTLKIKAIGEAQVWSAIFEYDFTIRPPWWHTWWAYSLYALLTIGVTGWYIQRLRQQINKKQQQLEREQYLNQELTALNEANGRFVPHDFLQILGKTSLKELQLGDQTATKMTILFADIRDYTTMSETMTPEQNFKFINAFLGRMGPIIKANGGFICQYFGDGIMALFKENHHLAIKAAIEMQQKIGFYNTKRIQQERQIFKVGIGLNTGQLMLGVIGDKERYDSSVISDAVNTAARMEGLTKVFGCSVILSEKTLVEMQNTLPVSDTSKVSDTLVANDNVSDTLKVSDTLDYRFLGKVKVKGKHIALKIYDLYEGDSKMVKDLKNQTKPSFEKAMHLYFEKEFGKAADLLKIVLEIHPADKAAKYYFEKALQYVVNGVEEAWSGVEEMVSK